MAFGDLVKSLIIRFKADGWELVKEQIDSIPDEKVISVKFDQNTFRSAIRDLAQLGRDLEYLDNKLGGGPRGPGFLSRLLFGGFGGASLGPLGTLPSFFTSVPGLAVAVGAISAAAVEIDMLATGLTAATAGVASFAALAFPTFSTISGAVSKINTDTATYDAATTKAARSAALKTIRADWAALDPVQKTAVQNVLALQNQFDTLAANFEQQVAPILNTLLQGPQKEIVGFSGGVRGRARPIYGMSAGGPIYQILNALPAFANPAAKAIEGLLTAFTNFLSSPGAKAFASQMQKIEGPAITAIGQGIGKVATAVGKLLTIFGPRDVVKAIQVFFDTISVGIRFLGNAIEWARVAWDHAWPWIKAKAKFLSDGFVEMARVVKGAFDAFNHAIDNARHFVFVAITDIWHTITTILSPGKLAAFLVNSGKSIISGLIAGMKAMAGPFASVLQWFTSLIPHLKGPIDKDRMLLYPHGQAIIQGLMAGMGSQVPAMSRQLTGITSGIATAAGRASYAGGGSETIVLHLNVSQQELFRWIQTGLLTLKRSRGYRVDTSLGLGLA